MSRHNNGPYLRKRKRKGCDAVFEIVWHIAGKRHARTTGTDDRDVANERLQHFVRHEWGNPSDRDHGTVDGLLDRAHDHGAGDHRDLFRRILGQEL